MVIHRGLAELSPNSGSSLSRPLPLQPAGLFCVEFGVYTVLLCPSPHTLPCALVCVLHFNSVPSPGPAVHSVR